MTLLNLNGRLIKRNFSEYLIDWDNKSLSKVQFKTKQFLKPFWNSHIVFEEFPVPSTLLRVDILNSTLKIAIEVQGFLHNEFNSHFHRHPVNYLKQIKNDVKKAQWLELNGFQLIEVFEDDVKNLSREYFATKHNLIL
jgi:hypothetical protein